MKTETKEDLRSDMTVSGIPYNRYIFWKKASVIAFVSSEAIRT